MQAALKVLTESTLFLHIVSFQPGRPYALLAFELEVYAAEAKHHPFQPRYAVQGASLLHHALVTGNKRMAKLLFRMCKDPYYAGMPRFALGDLLDLVCKRGSTWNSYTISPGRDPSEPLAEFHCDQKNKVMWLMKHHPEACTDLVYPQGILISARELRDFLVELLAAYAVNLSAFTVLAYPRALTHEFVESCASCGNQEAVKFLHVHASELPDRLFTTEAMNTAAKHGHLDVVRFLHENRTEGCTELAIDGAAQNGHWDVIKYLVENRTEGFSHRAIEWCARFGSRRRPGDFDMVQYLVKHRPEAIPDPTTWDMNAVVTYLRSLWAKRAITSDDPVLALRAAVIQLTDVNAFHEFHDQKHPVGCTSAEEWEDFSILTLAIQEQKDEFAAYLVTNCALARASIGFNELFAAGSESRPMNLDLLDLLLANGPSGDDADRVQGDVLELAASRSNMPFVKALLDRAVPCSQRTVVEALCGSLFELPMYLIKTYPELVTPISIHQVAHRGEYEYLFQLHASHAHLWNSFVVETVLCGDNAAAHATWEVVRWLYKRCSSIPLTNRTARSIWMGTVDDVLLFMWFVWQDPKITTSLAATERGHRLRLHSRLRALVPSLLVDVPDTLPWCCQLRFFRQRVECGELTLADVDEAVSPATWTNQLSLG